MLNKFVIFDTETTGLPGGPNRVVELAAVKVVNGQIQSQFQAVINQAHPCDKRAAETHGITPEEIAEGWQERTAWAVLNSMLADGSILVAHNLLFDAWFYAEALHRLGGKTIENNLLCTLTVSRRVLPKGTGYALEKLCTRLGLKLTGAHRALNDVMGTLQLLEVLKGKCDLNEHINKLGFLPFQGKPLYVPAHATAYAQ